MGDNSVGVATNMAGIGLTAVGIGGGFVTAVMADGMAGQLVSTRRELATATERLDTVHPTHSGPDSPTALADAVRGAEEAIPAIERSRRTTLRFLTGFAAVGVLGLAAALLSIPQTNPSN